MSFTVKGYSAASMHCGIKRKVKNDLAVVYSEVPAVASAVFTKNKVKAAPVVLSMKHVKDGLLSAIVVNSGNANAATGKSGMKNAEFMAAKTAEWLGLKTKDVFVCSTGVIGVKLPLKKVEKGIKALCAKLAPEKLSEAAAAILTTDTFKKMIELKFSLNGRECSIFGMAKGSGMIHPDMATMLCFLLTDVSITKKMLDLAFKSGVEDSFNSITVDGDTSTNDTALVMANGMAGNKVISAPGADFEAFAKELKGAMSILAKLIVRDGEGASKFIEVEVKGARTKAEGRLVAMSIAKSSLVKTAVYGADPNWGRVLSAVGNSGVKFKEERVKIYFGKLLVVKNGVELASFNEKRAHKQLEGKEVKIAVDLGLGKSAAVAWTCDLTEGYIKINAHYRT